MGFFGAYIFDGRMWQDFDPDSEPAPAFAEPWLSVEIHDTDFATVRYRPAGPGAGIAYLGFTPRTYFEDESASAPADVRREAEGLASWLRQLRGRGDETELRDLIAPFLADDMEIAEPEDDEAFEYDFTDLDDAEIFVEVKVSQFLTAIGLPLPDVLPAGQQGLASPPAPRSSWWS